MADRNRNKARRTHADLLFTAAWISLTVTGVGILVFGLVTAILPGESDPLSLRAIGVASIGMGLFGLAITVIPFRQVERWAWVTLWYYPVFWVAHLVWGLPPGEDHVHQVVFIFLSVAGLLIPVTKFFPRTRAPLP